MRILQFCPYQSPTLPSWIKHLLRELLLERMLLHLRLVDLNAEAGPEVLAHHHLREVFDPRRVFTDDARGEILDRFHDAAGVPFERGLTPAPGLVGEQLHEHPVSHPGIADMRFDSGELHRSRF